MIGFEPEEGGTSTWYAYKNSVMIGRIANIADGTVWRSDALIDNGDGSYDLPFSKELFMATGNVTITEIPDTIYITMQVKRGTAISSTDDIRILVSDTKEEPEIKPDEPIEGFSTDLLETYEVKLNQRWSGSSNAYVDQVGQIAFSVPYSEIEVEHLDL